MTIRALFDKGVYKSTLKRFSLGSVLYFLMLFLCTGMVILLAFEPCEVDTTMHRSEFLQEGFIQLSMCIAFAVPTVVALLCYRFVHSKKTSIFVHSLPVTRGANYLSTLAGAFTLMALPVIINAGVLYVISLCGYGGYFNDGDIAIWALFNLFVLFVMFSLSTFAAMCTGNSFALVVLNAMFVFVPLLIASITETVLVEFLYGYSYKRNLLHFATEINPAVFITEMAADISSWEERSIDFVGVAGFLIMAVLLYVLSYFVYKYRHAETSEEVAGFRVLNPIFKYFVTFVGTLAVFSLFSMFIPEKSIFFTFVVVLASAIFYFGSEMLLKKTVKVWHSYKGYLVFGGVFTAFILFLGLTSVFGYETYVPKFEDVEEAAIYNYYYQEDEPFTNDETLTRYIIAVHDDLVSKENRSILNHDAYHDTRIHITYKLKDGRVVTRRYGVGYAKNDAIMTEVYKYDEYKKACEAVFDERIKEIDSISVGNYDIAEKDNALNELFECIKADVSDLSYSKLRVGTGAYCSIRWVSNTETDSMHQQADNFVYYDWTDFYITKHYKNTIKWLEENGYGHIVISLLGVSSSLDYTKVNLADMRNVELSYHVGDVDIDCTIEDEADIRVLRDIFNGYYIERDDGNLIYDDDVCISFGDGEIWFCPALDGSGSFRLKNTDMYISVMNEDMEEFNRIVKKYGMVLK